jgi:proteic killer suppression protein
MRNFVHRGLKRLYAEDIAKGVHPIRWTSFARCWPSSMTCKTPEELRALPAWKVHPLTGDRKGTLEPQRDP